MGRYFPGQRDRQRHPRPTAASLPYHQHQGRELPAERQTQSRGMDAAGCRGGKLRRWRVMPLRLKKSSGWFAAGQEVAKALEILSDAAFKLYVYVCLRAERRSARIVCQPSAWAIALQCEP